MDEFRSRLGESAEVLKSNLSMATESGMRVVRQYSDEGRNLAIRAISEANSEASSAARNIMSNLLALLQRLKDTAKEVADPTMIYEQLRILFRDEISRNNAFFILVGLGFGTTGGVLLGFWLARPHLATPIMKSIACTSFRDPDNVVVCNTTVPQFEASSDILVRVRAAALNRIDRRIAFGYGRTLRRLIRNYDVNYNPELPLVLGRSCAGIVEAVGKGSKSGLEIGDEVWLAAQWYESGAASELVVVPETRISRKPFLIGFEGAASLPYSGCIALSLMDSHGLTEHTCKGKRILVQDACSPVGCVITQLAHKWGANVAVTCHTRSAPVIHELGASDIIVFANEHFRSNFIDVNVEKSNLINELASRDKFDFIFLTTRIAYDYKFLEKFLAKRGVIVDAVEPELASDEYGPLMRLLLGVLVKLKKTASVIFRTHPDWGGPHVCPLVLDRLAGFVNDETLKTVVDRVYTPNEVEQALDHICSEKSIGSTIITFR
ncbi:reticulon-4-interacting protein 1, mitochondrial-like isoform X1 [Culex pipiens pallens]|uniref:reticulon-4-interacting protein 1, mitochondrial-like isoform X1 n=2 Tax=Culex pipiens pallens TaxID=42434 RepID=UPI0022AA45A8|nr:reticulon-4-interacting protein 1, mitochondrial-like isoform X1 [Culex pipiens pallens]XP_052564780.1 reticulon-4-interacting protein 1, mitochondrial-like isoform X1 [Culex pipiens pallens]XP_052564781.1 reticulon-4-interacting protein 1, mitochondrial-like isoform X1 [Culex pipiens pallens]